jgi:hypothetical protein
MERETRLELATNSLEEKNSVENKGHTGRMRVLAD